MDKQTFFNEFGPKRDDYALPNGDVLPIRELTLAQRGKLHQAAKDNPIEAQALVVCLGCDLFDESDIESVKGMPGDLVSDIADAILALSGLMEDAEKN